MGFWGQHLGTLLVLGPVVGLFLLGLVITLRDGLVDLASGKGFRLFAIDLSWVLFRLAGYLAGLAAVQRMIGFRMNMVW
jgi:hypothetical protein